MAASGMSIKELVKLEDFKVGFFVMGRVHPWLTLSKVRVRVKH
jgi:hypothetical protein